MATTNIDTRLESVQRAQKIVLNHLVNTYGVDLVAEWAQCSVGMIYKYKNVNEDRYHIPASNMELLSKASAELGDLKLANRFVPQSHQVVTMVHGTANGTLKEENKRMYEIMHALNVAFDANNGLDFDDAMRAFRKLGSDLESEGKSLLRG